MLCALCSAGWAQRLGGWLGAVTCVACAALGGAALQSRHLDGLAQRLRGRFRGVVACSLLLAVLTASFVVLYPLANSGRLGGGSDRDEAIDQAVTALLAGDPPYRSPTYLGNPISPLPGALVLAAPFCVFPTCAVQNLFWLAAFAAVLARAGARQLAPLFLGATLLMAPEALRELETGGDMLANGLYASTFSACLLGALSGTPRPWSSRAAAALVGLALSSRAHVVLMVPALLTAVGRPLGWLRALELAAIATATCVLVTVPVYLWSPHTFSPLHTIDTMAAYEGTLTGVTWAAPAAAVLWASASAWTRWPRGVFARQAWALAVLPMLSSALLSVQVRSIALGPCAYALPSVFFALIDYTVAYGKARRPPT